MKGDTGCIDSYDEDAPLIQEEGKHQNAQEITISTVQGENGNGDSEKSEGVYFEKEEVLHAQQFKRLESESMQEKGEMKDKRFYFQTPVGHLLHGNAS